MPKSGRGQRMESVRMVPTEAIDIGLRYREDLGDLTGLKASITQFGIIQPITINRQGKKLVAGERRLQAAKELEMKEVPVIFWDIDNETDAREIELMENICRKDMEWPERANLERAIFNLKKDKDSTWTQVKHAEEMGISKGAIDRRMQLANVMDIVPELADCKTEDEAWKKYKRLEEDVVIEALRRKGGDRYGKAAKYAEDHFKIGDALGGMEEVQAGVVNFAEVDPPYGVDLAKRKGRNKDQSFMDLYNEIQAKDYPIFLEKIMSEVYRTLREDSFCIWWYGMSWHDLVLKTLRSVGFQVGDIPAIWTKGAVGQTASPDTMLGSGYEPFFICRKGKPKLAKPGRSNVFSYSPIPPATKIHPTEKPLDLMLEIVDTFTYPGSILAIPFLGSGVTLRAAYRRKMTGFGWELDEMIKRRFIGRVHTDIEEARQRMEREAKEKAGG